MRQLLAFVTPAGLRSNENAGSLNTRSPVPARAPALKKPSRLGICTSLSFSVGYYAWRTLQGTLPLKPSHFETEFSGGQKTSKVSFVRLTGIVKDQNYCSTIIRCDFVWRLSRSSLRSLHQRR